jgi:hypothetical protein
MRKWGGLCVSQCFDTTGDSNIAYCVPAWWMTNAALLLKDAKWFYRGAGVSISLTGRDVFLNPKNGAACQCYFYYLYAYAEG